MTGRQLFVGIYCRGFGEHRSRGADPYNFFLLGRGRAALQGNLGLQAVQILANRCNGEDMYPLPEQVTRRSLPLALRDDPVLDPHELTSVGIGPASDITRGENPRHTRFEILVDQNTAIDFQSRARGQRNRRPHSDTQDQEVRFECSPALENHSAPFEPGHRILHVKNHSVAFVKAAYEPPHLRTHDTPERLLLACHHVYGNPTRAQ
jgi:hypothetical protein